MLVKIVVSSVKIHAVAGFTIAATTYFESKFPAPKSITWENRRFRDSIKDSHNVQDSLML